MYGLFRSKIFSGILVLALFWLGLSFLNVREKSQIVEQEFEDIQTKVEQIEQDNSYLQKFLSYVETSSFLEREARIKLNYKNPDEKVTFVYLDALNNSSQSSEFDDNIPNYKKWWWYLFSDK